MAICLNNASFDPTTNALQLYDFWSPSDANRISAFTIRFAIMGSPTSGNLHPLLIDEIDKGIYVNDQGEIYYNSYINGFSVTTSGAGIDLVNFTAHTLRVEFHGPFDGDGLMVISVDGKVKLSVQRLAESDISYITLGSYYIGATRLSSRLEIYGMKLEGNYNAEWTGRRINNLAISRNVGLTGTISDRWYCDIGINNMAILILGSPAEWIREYDPLPDQGTYSLMMGTNPSEHLLLPTVVETGSNGYSMFIRLSQLEYNTLNLSNPQFGLLSSSTGSDTGIYLTITGKIQVKIAGTVVLLTPSAVLLQQSVNGSQSSYWDTVIHFIVDTVADEVYIGTGLVPYQSYPIPAGTNNLEFTSSHGVNAIGYQEGNQTGVRMRFYNMEYDTPVTGKHIIRSSASGGRGFTIPFSTDGDVELIGYTQDFSPWVYSTEEYPVQTKTNTPLTINVTTGQQYVLPKVIYQEFFTVDNGTSEDLIYTILTVDPTAHYINGNGDIVIYPMLDGQESFLVSAAVPDSMESESVLYRITVNSATGPGYDGLGFEETAFLATDESVAIVRRSAFDVDSFESTAFEMYQEILGGDTIRRWNGSEWVLVPLQRWNGTIWETISIKRWNGSEWI